MSEHSVLLAVQRQVQGLVDEKAALQAQIDALVAERDALRAQVAGLRREPAAAREILDYWRRAYIGDLPEERNAQTAYHTAGIDAEFDPLAGVAELRAENARLRDLLGKAAPATWALRTVVDPAGWPAPDAQAAYEATLPELADDAR